MPTTTQSNSSKTGTALANIPSADPRLLQAIWKRWQPERPELLIRLRPRPAVRHSGSR